jgi:hypothetical protein
MVTLTPETSTAVENHIADIYHIAERLLRMWQILGVRETHRLLGEINTHAHSAGLDIAISKGFYVFELIPRDKNLTISRTTSIDDL